MARRQGIPAGGVGEPGNRFGAEIVARHSRHDRGLIAEKLLLARVWSDVYPLRRIPFGADNGQVLHTEHAFDSARLLQRFALRLLLQRESEETNTSQREVKLTDSAARLRGGGITPTSKSQREEQPLSDSLQHYASSFCQHTP